MYEVPTSKKNPHKIYLSEKHEEFLARFGSRSNTRVIAHALDELMKQVADNEQAIFEISRT